MNRQARITLAIVSVALFMATLDNLVVTTALPSIQRALHASVAQLDWTVNAYTLAFAVLLMAGAALGDRYGRRTVFAAGVALFTLGSAAAALAPDPGTLIAARAVQGIGGAALMPLSLTLLNDAVPEDKRGLALGVWSGVAGLGVAFGPLIGGAVTEGISWQWIFWINVPIGIVLAPVTLRALRESHGPDRELDLPGIALAGIGLFGVVFGIVRSTALGWGSATVLVAVLAGVLVLGVFAMWERRAAAPMLPMEMFRSRGFSATNGVGLAMFFGAFGSIFLMAQFFQVAQGHSPFEAGLMTLPWTVMPIFVAPIAGIVSDRIGSRPLMAAGLMLQAGGIYWLSRIAAPDTPYPEQIVPLMMGGIGMALVFAPSANAVLRSVPERFAGKASGAMNAIREVGGALGIAVLSSVFAANGSFRTPELFVDGLKAAVPVGSAVLVAGALIALLVPALRSEQAEAPELAGAGLAEVDLA